MAQTWRAVPFLNFSTLTVTKQHLRRQLNLPPAPNSWSGGIHNAGFASIKNTTLTTNIGGNCSGAIVDAGYNISVDSSCG